MSEEFGIVRHRDLARGTGFDGRLWPFGFRAATVGAHVLDAYGSSALVGKRKTYGAGRLPKEGAEFQRLLLKLHTGLGMKLHAYHAENPCGKYGYRIFDCNHKDWGKG